MSLPCPALSSGWTSTAKMSFGEIEADEEAQDEGHQRPQEPAPELDQMLEQRLLGVVDVLHGSGRFSGGSSSSAGRRERQRRLGISATGGISSGCPARDNARRPDAAA